MILVTGGLGFIGSHTVRALLDQGEECVLVQRRESELSPVLAGASVVLEQADVTDLDSLREAGNRHTITGIVHLAGSMPWPALPGQPVEQARSALEGYFNVMQVAADWGVKRVGVASTIGVYGGVTAEGALSEELPLPMTAPHVIPAFKKIGELLNAHLAGLTGMDIVNYRISGTWGPGGHAASPFFAGPALVHAAARNEKPDLSRLLSVPNTGDALDVCYVKDTGRAIALLQLSEKLNHSTYNVASGRATSNADVIAAIKKVVPDAAVDLPQGRESANTYLDITRIHGDTGYQPDWDTERATVDYIAWLRAGHQI